MGRKALPSGALQAVPHSSPENDAEIDQMNAEGGAQLQVEHMTAQSLAKYSEAMRLIGRLDAIDFYATVSGSLIAKTFLKLKETKVYRGYPYIGEGGKVATVATLEEFCKLKMPVSYRRCHEIAANYQALGQQLFEASEHLGFRESDYRALRALPADDRVAVEQAIAEAADHGDRDAALSTMAELVARHKSARDEAEAERAAAEATRDEIKKDYQASARLLGEAKAKVRRYESGDLVPPPLDEQMAEWPRASGYLTGEIRAHLTRIGLMIAAAERAIISLAPDEDTPESDMVERACRCWYDAAGADLQRLNEELLGVMAHLDRVVGSFAYPRAGLDGGREQ